MTQGSPRPVDPAAIAAPLARYSHALLVPAGFELLVSSGQLGLGPDGAIPDDPHDQCVLIFENLRAILDEVGMSFADVIRFNAYVTDRSYFPIYGEVRGRYVTGRAFASTLVIVSGFTRPEFKVEVEITAARRAPAGAR